MISNRRKQIRKQFASRKWKCDGSRPSRERPRRRKLKLWRKNGR
jgi:hypothetical protein